jgi:hypothetical protein
MHQRVRTAVYAYNGYAHRTRGEHMHTIRAAADTSSWAVRVVPTFKPGRKKAQHRWALALAVTRSRFPRKTASQVRCNGVFGAIFRELEWKITKCLCVRGRGWSRKLRTHCTHMKRACMTVCRGRGMHPGYLGCIPGIIHNHILEARVHFRMCAVAVRSMRGPSHLAAGHRPDAGITEHVLLLEKLGVRQGLHGQVCLQPAPRTVLTMRGTGYNTGLHGQG